MNDIAADETSANGQKLLAQLVQANYNDYAAVSQQLIDGYQKEIAELKAERDIVRERMEELCGKPWAPSTNAVLAAMFVTRAEIAERVAGESS